MSDPNKNVHLDDHIVEIYAGKTKLFEPEVTLQDATSAAVSSWIYYLSRKPR